MTNRTLLVLVFATFLGIQLFAQENPSGEWPAYGRGGGGDRFSSLSQINRGNVGQLKNVWTYRTGDVAARGKTRSTSAFQMTPIMVDGTLYLTTPFNRVMALDPGTGKEKWVFDPKIDLGRGYHNQLNSRGLSTWLDSNRKKDERCRRRIFIGTNDARLISIDAATGTKCTDFGNGGEIDLAKGMGVSKTSPGEYGLTSPPAIVNDVVIVGAAIGDNNRVTAPSGAVRAFDVRSGKLRWAWDPVPPGYERQAKKNPKTEAGFYMGTANVWSVISVDEKRNLVFLPTGNTSPDYYGGERNGIDYYSSSVVALNAKTGDVVWHFQTVHHDVWDFDIPAQPALITVTKNGKRIPAVAVATKMGHLFLFGGQKVS